jgi:uncharacterized protein (DUF2461 family)
MAFRGFPPEAITFYEGLEADNSKSYWTANKHIYDQAVKEPFEALCEEIDEAYRPLRLFRPYRDVRFSADKTPYKTAAAASGESEDGSVYYVQLSATGIHDELKTAPRGYGKDHPRIALLRRKGLIAAQSWPIAKWLHTAQAKSRLEASWRGCDPLNAWLAKHVGPSELAPDERNIR